MTIDRVSRARALRTHLRALALAACCAAWTSTAAATACGSGNYPFPFTDVAAVGDAFCPGIMQAYVTGVTKGTTATTFGPNDPVSRTQMTTFLQRSIDQEIGRIGRRAALGKWWTPRAYQAMQTINVGNALHCAADGKSIWTATNGNVVQVQASTGKILGTWTNATNSQAVQVGAGKVFATGNLPSAPGALYVIDPTQPAGAVTLAAANIGGNPQALAFDGSRIWSANFNPGSVSIVSLQPTTPYPVTTVTAGFGTLSGILYDGTNIWVTDPTTDPGKLHRLDSAGNVLQSVAVGASPRGAVFDGANIWVPNTFGNSVTVVQAVSGAIVGTIVANPTNQLNGPYGASFDGERVLITNIGGNSVSVFKAADMSVMANVNLGTSVFPYAPCNDGINFFVPLSTANMLVRF
jgi:hypothetical protein